MSIYKKLSSYFVFFIAVCQSIHPQFKHTIKRTVFFLYRSPCYLYKSFFLPQTPQKRQQLEITAAELNLHRHDMKSLSHCYRFWCYLRQFDLMLKGKPLEGCQEHALFHRVRQSFIRALLTFQQSFFVGMFIDMLCPILLNRRQNLSCILCLRSYRRRRFSLRRWQSSTLLRKGYFPASFTTTRECFDVRKARG